MQQAPSMSGGQSPARGRSGALDVLPRPVVILVGHFGSGKTEVAINLALAWRQRHCPVTLVDLDLVKPYFRCRAARDDLALHGIGLVAPGEDRLFADLPILLAEVRGALTRSVEPEARVIVDVGGADTGARVMGSLAVHVDPARTDILFVVNGNRPFAGDVPAIAAMVREVESAARLQVSGLVANTHLMEETTAETVRCGIRLAEATGRATGVPVRFAAALGRLEAALEDEGVPVLPIERHILPPDDPRWSRRRQRPTVI